MVVLDIGAHIGYYTLIAASLVGEEGKVFAIEPDPGNFALLKKNVEVNGYKNVILIQKAVSNRSGETALICDDEQTASHHIWRTVGDETKVVKVDMITLDEFFADASFTIDLIKMDIEGAEELALQGMSRLLTNPERTRDIKIFSEFCPSWIRRCGSSPEDYLNKLAQYGFKINIVNEKNNKVEAINRDEFSTICKNVHPVNLFCTR
jgi:FkbM family methyltransferase